MSQKDSLTHLAYRSLLDSLEDILGENGKNSVLRFAKLDDMITSPPDYDTEKRVEYESVTKLYIGVRDIIGNSGYEAIMFRAGMFMIKMVVEHSEAIRNLIAAKMDSVEKLKIAYTAYITNAGYDPEEVLESIPDKNQFLIHRPDCTECEELIKDEKKRKEFTKPSCAFMTGVMKGVGECFKKEIQSEVQETKCRFVGDDECVFTITYKT
ncbi:MAG: 4-vinyl reductase [Deltaproteobacteria bacterium]|nr:4-vinyl reductase [Candidatus Zymogenaceae bacterium]